jgi:hypothetical protein
MPRDPDACPRCGLINNPQFPHVRTSGQVVPYVILLENCPSARSPVPAVDRGGRALDRDSGGPGHELHALDLTRSSTLGSTPGCMAGAAFTLCARVRTDLEWWAILSAAAFIGALAVCLAFRLGPCAELRLAGF